MNDIDLYYIDRAIKTAILSGNKYVQLSSVDKNNEPAHYYPNTRTRAYFKNLQTNKIHYGQENSFRNESGYNFWKDGFTNIGRDSVINEIFNNLVEWGIFSSIDIERKQELVVHYKRIVKMLEIERQEKLPSTAKPLC